MRILTEIIEDVRNGNRPEYDELIYAICAMNALSVFDSNALSKLSIAETENKPKQLVYSAIWQHKESFERWKRALNTDPKIFIGWNNDPANSEFVERRKQSMKLFQKIIDKHGDKNE